MGKSSKSSSRKRREAQTLKDPKIQALDQDSLLTSLAVALLNWLHSCCASSSTQITAFLTTVSNTTWFYIEPISTRLQDVFQAVSTPVSQKYNAFKTFFKAHFDHFKQISQEKCILAHESVANAYKCVCNYLEPLDTLAKEVLQQMRAFATSVYDNIVVPSFEGVKLAYEILKSIAETAIEQIKNLSVKIWHKMLEMRDYLSPHVTWLHEKTVFYLKQFAVGFDEKMKHVWNENKPWICSMFDKVCEWFSKCCDWVETMKNDVKTYLTQVWNKISEFVQNWIDSVCLWFASVRDGFKSHLRQVYMTYVRGLFWDPLKSCVTSACNWCKRVNAISKHFRDQLNFLKTQILSKMNNFYNKISSFFIKISNNCTQNLEIFKSKLYDVLHEYFVSALNEIKSNSQKLYVLYEQHVWKRLKPRLRDISNILTRFDKTFESYVLQPGLEQLKSLNKTTIAPLHQWFVSKKSDFYKIANKKIEYILETININFNIIVNVIVIKMNDMYRMILERDVTKVAVYNKNDYNNDNRMVSDTFEAGIWHSDLLSIDDNRNDIVGNCDNTPVFVCKRCDSAGDACLEALDCDIVSCCDTSLRVVLFKLWLRNNCNWRQCNVKLFLHINFDTTATAAGADFTKLDKYWIGSYRLETCASYTIPVYKHVITQSIEKSLKRKKKSKKKRKMLLDCCDDNNDDVEHVLEERMDRMERMKEMNEKLEYYVSVWFYPENVQETEFIQSRQGIETIAKQDERQTEEKEEENGEERSQQQLQSAPQIGGHGVRYIVEDAEKLALSRFFVKCCKPEVI